MLRWTLLESMRAVALMLLVSVVSFAVFDRFATPDWFGTVGPGRAIGLSPTEASGRDRARFLFAQDIEDAQSRTLRDLSLLGIPAQRERARARLRARGTVIVPIAFDALSNGPSAQRDETFHILNEFAPKLTGGDREVPPADPEQARTWWATFMALHEIDLRDAFARRHVQRLVEYDSPNAREQLARLGTLALPALFDALDDEQDANSARRLCDLASEIVGVDRTIPADASAERTRSIVAQWRAWWFARRFDYARLGQVRRRWGRVTEARYALWLRSAFDGRLGSAAVTGRSVHAELRARLPVSTLLAGVSGLCATALVVAFGGGRVLRGRPLATKLLDLLAALIPGSIAFAVGFLAVCSACSQGGSALGAARRALSNGGRITLAIVTLTLLTVGLLQRGQARVVLQAVRVEAERWAHRGDRPRFSRWLRHGWRVGVASLLAPAALNALLILGLTMLVEPVFGVAGMGDLTLRSLARRDGSWLQIAALSIVPIALATGWARRALYWALGAEDLAFTRRRPRASSEPPPS
jgi:ABC-type dipeptide/oligopeptide/nickel transport system permease component